MPDERQVEDDAACALPIHMLAIRPQKRSGLAVITCGPGAMPWMIIAPSISAMVALPGMPSVSVGMNVVCARRCWRFRPRDAFDRALAEARRVLRQFFLDHVGGERGDRGPGAGQRAEEGADARAAHDRPEAMP